MDWGWIVAGVLISGAVGVLLARFDPRNPRKPTGAPLEPEEWDRRFKLLAADVNDALEKMERLNDRVRKRAKVPDEPAEPVVNGGFKSGAQVYSYAKQRGLIR